MSSVNRTPRHIFVRFSMGFPTTDPQDPVVIWAEINLGSRSRKFELQPLRHRIGSEGSDEAAEWYLKEDRQVTTKIFWRTTSNVLTLSSRNLQTTRPLRLTLGEIAQTPNQQQDNFGFDQFALTGGSIELVRPLLNPINPFAQLLSRLWPTGDFRDVVKLHCEPGGLHVQGRLPATFFARNPEPNAPPLSDADREIVLRVPRDERDRFSPDGDAANERPYWTLGNYPFVRNIALGTMFPTAIDHVRAWADSIARFELDPQKNTAPRDRREQSSLVDSVNAQPEESCDVGIFRTGTGDSAAITWFAREIRTRINLGGGQAAEATYLPEQIEGVAPLSIQQPWKVNFAAPARQASTGPPDSIPTLSLTLVRPNTVTPNVSSNLHPVSVPTTVFLPPNAGKISEPNAIESHRLWLCTESGWAAIDAAAPRAEIDPKQDTQGAISGVLEIDKIVAQLKPDRPSNGLSVQAKTRLTGAVDLLLSGVGDESQSLKFQADDAFLTVATQPVFYQSPLPVTGDADTPSPTPMLPTLTVDSAEKVDKTVDVDETITRLEQSLANERMQPGIFASDNVTKPIDSDKPKPLLITLETENAFAVSVPSESVTVWQRPQSTSAAHQPGATRKSLPLVRSYPLDPDQDLSGFLDANRGLLPYRTRPRSPKVSFSFSPVGLPALVVNEQGDGILSAIDDSARVQLAAPWRFVNAAGRGGSPAYFLPTIPGLEFDPKAAFAEVPAETEWVYRHGVPVLDEAYATTAESRQDPTTGSQTAPAPDPGDLPPGFDPTRVEGTEAFRFGPASPATADGWLPKTDVDQAGRAGSLVLQGLTASLNGRLPAVKGTLSNHDATAALSIEFSRKESVAGLNADLRITKPDPALPDLPTFDVGLAPGGDPDPLEYDDRIRNNGLPLLSALTDVNILTHDNIGTRHEQSLIPGTARSRRIGDQAPLTRVSQRADLVTPGSPVPMQIELLGIDVETAGSAASNSPCQTWLLHDGQGMLPRVGGFSFRPRRLVQFGVDATSPILTVEGSIELKHPTNQYVPFDSRSSLSLPGESSMALTWRKLIGGDWTLTSVTGQLDWRFISSSETGVLEITQLTATCTGLPENDVWPMSIDTIELATINGPLEIDLQGANASVPARLGNGKLQLLGSVDITRNDFELNIDAFTIDQTEFDTPVLVNEGPIPDWSDTDIRLKHALSWKKEVAPLKWSLLFGFDHNSAPDGWTLLVESDGVVLVKTAVTATQAGSNRLLFLSPQTAAPSTTSLPGASWFQRQSDTADQAVGGAFFRKPDELSAFSAHLLLRLVPHTDLTDLDGELAARLSLETPGANTQQQLTCSGWLKMTNQLPLQTSTETVTHQATLVFRNAPWSIDSVFRGLGPQGMGHDLVLLVEHSLTVDNRTASWQVIQPVRFSQRKDFSKRYLSTVVTGSQLVIDLSWAYWARIPNDQQPSGDGGSIELKSPFLSSQWRFQLRPRTRGEFDRESAFVARLPFGYAGPGSLTSQDLTLDDDLSGSREVITSGASAGSTVARLSGRTRELSTSRQLLPASEVPEFDRGGPNAEWLDPAFLDEYFGDADGTVLSDSTPPRLVPPLLPAFADSNGDATTKLPAAVSDWAWLLAALEAAPENSTLPLVAAALRTPYVPRSTPQPLAGSAFVEFPFQFHKVDVEFKESTDRIDAQLLAFVRNMLRIVRRAGLDSITGERGQTAVDWSRGILEETRRTDAAIVFRDYRVTFPAGGQPGKNFYSAFVPRPVSASRTERPVWSNTALSPMPETNGGPPGYDSDQRRRSPSPRLVDRNGNREPITPSNRPVVTVPIGQLDSAAEYFAFAGRPELRPFEQGAPGIAASRFRLALSGPRSNGETAPSLLPARRANVEADVNRSLTSSGEITGELIGLTKTEDVPFEVSQTSDRSTTPWLVYPSSGGAPHARRDVVLRKWNEAGEVVTIAPPLVDIVIWARRPGELTRTLVAGYRAGYPQVDSDAPFEDSPAISQDITLRRPRAKAGLFEQVSIEPTRTHRLLGGLFQYTRLRLTQTLDATPAPAPAEAYMVLADQSQIGASVTSVSEAEVSPSLLRTTANVVNPYSLFLVADENFAPAAKFPSNEQMVQTVLIVRSGSADLPPGQAYGSDRKPPVERIVNRTVGPTEERWVVLLDRELESPANKPEQWTKLFDDAFSRDVIAKVDSTGIEALTKLLNDAASANPLKPVYILLATYTRSVDNASEDWTKPGAPLAVIKIQFLKSENDLDKPKSALTLLQAARTVKQPDPGDENYGFAGFGRLGDDDFQPIRPLPFRPTADSDTALTVPPTRVGWARVADLQTLDRLSNKAIAPDQKTGNVPPAFDFDVVFYGAGGELIPTVPPRTT